MRQPAVFFGHGSPMNALGGPYADAWRALGEQIGKPRGVVMISAHWETRGLGVTAQEQPETIHDFGGFPPELHAMQYPAPGSPSLAGRVADLTGAQATTQWGLDHGTWSVLAHVWPEADVPIVQLSLDRTLDARGHYELAKALRPLRDEGVLIAGSGDFVHNLRTWKRAGGEPYAWAVDFNEAVKRAFVAGNPRRSYRLGESGRGGPAQRADRRALSAAALRRGPAGAGRGCQLLYRRHRGRFDLDDRRPDRLIQAPI